MRRWWLSPYGKYSLWVLAMRALHRFDRHYVPNGRCLWCGLNTRA